MHIRVTKDLKRLPCEQARAAAQLAMGSALAIELLATHAHRVSWRQILIHKAGSGDCGKVLSGIASLILYKHLFIYTTSCLHQCGAYCDLTTSSHRPQSTSSAGAT